MTEFPLITQLVPISPLRPPPSSLAAEIPHFLKSRVSSHSSQLVLNEWLNSLRKLPFLGNRLHQQVSFLSILFLHGLKLIQLLEASSPILSISLKIWSSTPDCIGKWTGSHLKLDWIAQLFPNLCEGLLSLFLVSHYALYLFGYLTRELTPRINLKSFWSSQ